MHILPTSRTREFRVADCLMVSERGSPLEFALCSSILQSDTTEAFSDGAGKAGEAGEAAPHKRGAVLAAYFSVLKPFLLPRHATGKRRPVYACAIITALTLVTFYSSSWLLCLWSTFPLPIWRQSWAVSIGLR